MGGAFFANLFYNGLCARITEGVNLAVGVFVEVRGSRRSRWSPRAHDSMDADAFHDLYFEFRYGTSANAWRQAVQVAFRATFPAFLCSFGIFLETILDVKLHGIRLQNMCVQCPFGFYVRTKTEIDF